MNPQQEEHLGIKSKPEKKRQQGESPKPDVGTSPPKRMKRSQEKVEMPCFELKKCPQCTFTAPTETQISHHMDGTHRYA